MGKIRTQGFRGYTSKPGVINVPGLGVDCENIIIHDGELCNRPHINKLAAFNRPGVTLHTFFRDSQNQAYHLWYEKGTINQPFWIALDNKLDHTNTNVWLRETFWPNGIDVNYAQIPYGNFVQVGSWTFMLGRFHRSFTNNIDKPRMPRFKRVFHPIRQNIDPEVIPLLQGITPPVAVAATNVASASDGMFPAGTVQLAVTFVTNVDNVDPDELNPDGTSYGNDLVLGVNDVESTAVVSETITPSLNDYATAKVYLPKDWIRLEPVQLASGHVSMGNRIGTYIRVQSDGESLYYFHRYVRGTQILRETDTTSDYFGYYYITCTIGLDTQTAVDRTRTAPFVDRGVPDAGGHGEFFKSRMYYTSFEDVYQNINGNNLQYSQITNANGNEANYIEGSVAVGDGNSLTGVVEFLGQLIIFKEDSIHVLTGDIVSQQSEVRGLFKKVGCVNIDGGKAYIVIDNVLYFAHSTGIYRWTGQGPPELISGPIKDDLDVIITKHTVAYSYTRFGYDPTYALLYVIVPPTPASAAIHESLPSFICHLKEGLVWTKTRLGKPDTELGDSLLQVIESPSNDRYEVSANSFKRLQLVSEPPLSFEYNRLSTWVGSAMDAGEPARKKHWRFLSIAVNNKFLGRITPITVSVIDSENNVTVLAMANDLNKRVHLGRHLSEMSLKIEPKVPEGNVLVLPFRISGYNLDVNLRGRR